MIILFVNIYFSRKADAKVRKSLEIWGLIWEFFAFCALFFDVFTSIALKIYAE